MAKKLSLANTVSLADAFAAAGKADITNVKVDLDLVGALQRTFKGRKATTAGYKEFYKATQRGALLAYLKGRLGVIVQEATRIADLKGYKDSDLSDERRTFEQEQACATFRKRWSRAIATADIKSPEQRGAHGARTGDVKEPVEEVAPIVPAPTTPTKGVPTEYVQLQAAALLAFSNKHAKTLPLAYKEAILAFEKAIASAR